MLRSITDLKKIPENQLTAEEKLALFGPGTAARILYRQIKRPDGSLAIVHRAFGPTEKPSEDWKDSPAAFGVITHPSRDQRDDDAYDDVLAELPGSSEAPAAALRRKAG